MNEVHKLLIDVLNKMDNQSEEQIRNDFKTVVFGLVSFIANEQPALLNKGNDDKTQMKLFFKLMSSIATDGMMSMAMPSMAKKLEDKMKPISPIFPLIKKYANE